MTSPWPCPSFMYSQCSRKATNPTNCCFKTGSVDASSISLFASKRKNKEKKIEPLISTWAFLKIYFFKVFVAFLFMLIKCCVNKWLFNDNHPSPRVYILFKIKDIQVTENREKQEILIFSPISFKLSLLVFSD